jgi:hypothetical protein
VGPGRSPCLRPRTARPSARRWFASQPRRGVRDRYDHHRRRRHQFARGRPGEDSLPLVTSTHRSWT